MEGGQLVEARRRRQEIVLQVVDKIIGLILPKGAVVEVLAGATEKASKEILTIVNDRVLIGLTHRVLLCKWFELGVGALILFIVVRLIYAILFAEVVGLAALGRHFKGILPLNSLAALSELKVVIHMLFCFF